MRGGRPPRPDRLRSGRPNRGGPSPGARPPLVEQQKKPRRLVPACGTETFLDEVGVAHGKRLGGGGPSLVRVAAALQRRARKMRGSGLRDAADPPWIPIDENCEVRGRARRSIRGSACTERLEFEMTPTIQPRGAPACAGAPFSPPGPVAWWQRPPESGYVLKSCRRHSRRSRCPLRRRPYAQIFRFRRDTSDYKRPSPVRSRLVPLRRAPNLW